MVQNKVLFEDLFCFSTGGWLYRSTVHICLFKFGRGSFEELFLLHYLGHRFRGLFECILAICNQLSDLVEVYHEEHIREFRICIKTAQRNNLLI